MAKKGKKGGVAYDLSKVWSTEIRVGTIVTAVAIYHLAKFAASIYLT